jgi:enterochelin esterase-like enzyme
MNDLATNELSRRLRAVAFAVLMPVLFHGLSALAETKATNQDLAAYRYGDAGNYTLGPESMPQAGIPQGSVIKYKLETSSVYPETIHDYWVYVPKQYDSTNPACLMVFLDGGLFLDTKVNATAVLDNLISSKEIPVIIGLFINAGDKGPGLPLWGGVDNRSLEYDSLGDRYVRFLIGDVLPILASKYAISEDPGCRGIAGLSSGGAAAFTAAWERPDAFRKVVSLVGSFTNIRGAHNYPSLIRGTGRKPIRVFLQSGSRDLDIVFGNWPIANKDMAAAFEYKEYDYKFVFGDGGHSINHGASILPDIMRWIWRDYPLGNVK